MPVSSYTKELTTSLRKTPNLKAYEVYFILPQNLSMGRLYFPASWDAENSDNEFTVLKPKWFSI